METQTATVSGPSSRAKTLLRVVLFVVAGGTLSCDILLRVARISKTENVRKCVTVEGTYMGIVLYNMGMSHKNETHNLDAKRCDVG
jgi:hypothetical protein